MIVIALPFVIASCVILIAAVAAWRKDRAAPPAPHTNDQGPWTLSWVFLRLVLMAIWSVLALFTAGIVGMAAAHSESHVVSTMVLLVVGLGWLVGVGWLGRQIIQRLW
jgi:hypothetical protein